MLVNHIHGQDLVLIKAPVDYKDIARHLDASPVDHHYPGENRYRSMSRFAHANSELERLPPKPLYQSEYINRLENYGGLSRDYVDLPESLQKDPAFSALMRTWIAHIPDAVEAFSCHHIRTVTPGNPVPEGRHRDGYKWTGLYIAQRKNIRPETGHTKFWTRDTEEEVFSDVLDSGDLLIFNDRKFTHYTDSVVAVNGEAGVRDVFIITYPEHGYIETRDDEIE